MEQRHHQRLREALQTLPCPPLTLHRLKISESRSARQSTAPHQAVTQNGPLKELTEEEEGHDQILMRTQPLHIQVQLLETPRMFTYTHHLSSRSLSLFRTYPKTRSLQTVLYKAGLTHMTPSYAGRNYFKFFLTQLFYLFGCRLLFSQLLIPVPTPAGDGCPRFVL